MSYEIELFMRTGLPAMIAFLIAAIPWSFEMNLPKPKLWFSVVAGLICLAAAFVCIYSYSLRQDNSTLLLTVLSLMGAVTIIIHAQGESGEILYVQPVIKLPVFFWLFSKII